MSAFLVPRRLTVDLSQGGVYVLITLYGLLLYLFMVNAY